MRRTAVLILIVSLTLPAFAAPSRKQSTVRATISRFLIWAQSRLGPPWPAPVPEPPSETETSTATTVESPRVTAPTG